MWESSSLDSFVFAKFQFILPHDWSKLLNKCYCFIYLQAESKCIKKVHKNCCISNFSGMENFEHSFKQSSIKIVLIPLSTSLKFERWLREKRAVLPIYFNKASPWRQKISSEIFYYRMKSNLYGIGEIVTLLNIRIRIISIYISER